MDIKRAPRPWYKKYSTQISATLLLAAIIIYTIYVALSPRQMIIDSERVRIAEVKETAFIEFVESEGVIQPIKTIQLNAFESGYVEQIACEEGAMLHQGDTILILNNPELLRSIDEERQEWEKSKRSLQEQKIEMEQRSINLRIQTLEQEYQINTLKRKLTQSREEYSMGIKSRAELNIVEAENEYLHKRLTLQIQSLRHDSATTALRREIIEAEHKAALRRLQNATKRTERLVIRAPCDGQLGNLNLIIGQQIAAGNKVGELKIMNQYKVSTQLSEYFIERIFPGQPATIIQREDTFNLHVSRVMPEVKERKFAVDLLFNDSTPHNIRLGKSYLVKIELAQPEQTIVIPRGDFYAKSNGLWIFRLEEGTNIARRTDIELGRQNPEQFEVIKGLKPGDRVITTGYNQTGNAEEIIIEP